MRKCVLLQPGENRRSLGRGKSKRTFSAFSGAGVCYRRGEASSGKERQSSRGEGLRSIPALPEKVNEDSQIPKSHGE